MQPDIAAYNGALSDAERAVCDALAESFDGALPDAESKVWHRTAVWFLEGNPVVGYAPRKAGVQVLFWSGQSFDEPKLKPEGKFKAAQVYFTDVAQLAPADLQRWLTKARSIQWDYKNLVQRKGTLLKLGAW